VAIPAGTVCAGGQRGDASTRPFATNAKERGTPNLVLLAKARATGQPGRRGD